MSNKSFKFRQFVVCQNKCAMKVGTDGTLLGAWAAAPAGECRILDIGTGTGLLALMMAQRYPQAIVTGIDIDPDSVIQASGNVEASPFADRVRILLADVAHFDEEPYDAIVCNPPYFNHSLTCPDNQRSLARHTISLSYEVLMQSARRLLTENGLFSLIIPFDYLSKIESESALASFFLSRRCAVSSTPKKSPRRYLVEYRKKLQESIDITEGIIETSPNVRSDWYQQLTKDFYL